jgi:hypothetical protein
MKKSVLVAALAAVMIFGIVASAQAANSDVVNISAEVNSMITVTAGADINFGAFDPDAANPAPVSQPVVVQSNTPYTLSRDATGTLVANNMLSITGDALGAAPKANGGQPYAQSYALNLRPAGVWMDAGVYTAVVTYTAVP